MMHSKLKFINFLLFGAVLSALPLIASAEKEFPKPHLEIVDPIFNFGTVSDETVVRHDFILRNTGKADLVIQRTVPSCGCTVVTTVGNAVPSPGTTSVAGNTIPAGGQGIVQVAFDTKGFSGPKVKTIRLYTNDAEASAPMLTLKGAIEPNISVEPRRVFFDDIVQGGLDGVRSAEVTVRTRPGSKLSLGDIVSASPHLLVESLGADSPSEKRVKITIGADTPVGEFRDRVIVNIEGGDSKSVNIPVFASIKSQLRLEPSTVSFGVLEGSETITRSVKFDNFTGHPVSVKDLVSSDPAVTGSIKTVEPGRTFVLDVKVDPTKIQHDLRASLEVVTDPATDSKSVLSIFGILPPRG